jgi:porin
MPAGTRVVTGKFQVTALRVAARLVPIALSVLAALPAHAAAGALELPQSGFDVKFVGESYANLSGGFQRGSEGNAIVDAQATLADQDIGWGDGGAWYLDLKHIQGANPSASLTGDVQVASNIAAPAANRVYEFWYEHLLFERKLNLRAGIIDLNRYFDAVPGSTALNNSSFGIQPALSLNAPSSIFPKPGWGTMLTARASDTVRLQIGWFQGHPAARDTPLGHGRMLIGEAQYQVATMAPLWMLGVWQYTQPEGSGYGEPGSDWGAYGAWSLPLVNAHRRLFLQLGVSPPQASVAPYYFEAGYTWYGPFASRAHDSMSVGVARAWLHVPDKVSAETALEANYAMRLNRFLTLAPDLQYILTPLRQPAVPRSNAWVFMLRLYAALH